MKIRPVGADFFYADRQTDTTKLMVAFRNYSKASEHLKCVQVEHFVNNITNDILQCVWFRLSSLVRLVHSCYLNSATVEWCFFLIRN
jgi:hypothetical protein